MNASGFAYLARLTFRDPVEAWRRISGLGLTTRDRWLALMALIAVSTLAGWMMDALLSPLAPPPGDATAQLMEAVRLQLEHRPLVFAIIQLAGSIVTIALVTRIGRIFGGRASFDDVLLAAVWMKALLLVLQLGQLFLVSFALPIAAILAMIETLAFLYLAVRLTQVVHGFSSPFRVAIGMIASFFVLILALTTVMVLLGLSPTEI